MNSLLLSVVIFSFGHRVFADSNYTLYSHLECANVEQHCLDPDGVCNQLSKSSKVLTTQVSDCYVYCAANAECFGFEVISYGRDGAQCSLFGADLCGDDLVNGTESGIYVQYETTWQPQGNNFTCTSDSTSLLYACYSDTGSCLPSDVAYSCQLAGPVGEKCVGFEIDDKLLAYKYHYAECDQDVPPAEDTTYYIMPNVTSNFTRPNTTIIGYCNDTSGYKTMGKYMCGCLSQNGTGSWDGIPCGLFQDLVGCISQFQTYFMIYSYNKVMFSIARALGWEGSGEEYATIILAILVIAKMFYFAITGQLASGKCVAFVELLVQLISDSDTLSSSVSSISGCEPFSTTYLFTEPVTFQSQFALYPLLSLDDDIPELYENFIDHFQDLTANYKSAKLAVERMFGARHASDTKAYRDRKQEAQVFCEDFLGLAAGSGVILEEVIGEILSEDNVNYTIPLDMNVYRDDLRDFILDVQANGFPELDQMILNRFEADVKPPELITNIELYEFFWDQIGYGDAISVSEILTDFSSIFEEGDGQGFHRLCDECQWESGCNFQQALCVEDGLSITLKCVCDLGSISRPFETFPPGKDGFDCGCNPVNAMVLFFITSKDGDGDLMQGVSCYERFPNRNAISAKGGSSGDWTSYDTVDDCELACTTASCHIYAWHEIGFASGWSGKCVLWSYTEAEEAERLYVDSWSHQGGITSGMATGVPCADDDDVMDSLGEVESTIEQLVDILLNVTGVGEDLMRVIGSQTLSDRVLTNVAVMANAEGSGNSDHEDILKMIKSEIEKEDESEHPLLAVHSQMICIQGCPDGDGDCQAHGHPADRDGPPAGGDGPPADGGGHPEDGGEHPEDEHGDGPPGDGPPGDGPTGDGPHGDGPPGDGPPGDGPPGNGSPGDGPPEDGLPRDGPHGDGGGPPEDGHEPPADGDGSPVDGGGPHEDGHGPHAGGNGPPADGHGPPTDGDGPPTDGDGPPTDGHGPPADGDMPPGGP